MKKLLILALSLSVFFEPVFGKEMEKEPIRIGSIFEYSQAAKWGQALDRGFALALAEINAAGGIKGRPLEVIRRDNKMDVGETIRLAEELDQRDGVVLFTGTVSSNTSLALAEWARKNNKIFMVNVACTDELITKNPSPNTFKIHPLCSSLGLMLAEKAAAVPAKRWGYIGFTSEYAHSVYKQFKKRLSELRPDVEWVSYQEQPIFKLDAASAVNKIRADSPEALLNLLVTTDQLGFLRAGRVMDLFRTIKTVVSPNFGLPEEHEGLAAMDLPRGWITGGYPLDEIEVPEHELFVKAFRAKFNTSPNHTSFVAYTTMKAIASGLDTAKDMSTESLREALTGLTFMSPIGPLTLDEKTHQSTLGFWVGTTTVEGGNLRLDDWSYMPGDEYMPSDEPKAIEGKDGT